MKKIFTLILSLATVSTVLAGGPMTNSNQSAAFLRSIARGTTLDTDAVYAENHHKYRKKEIQR